MVPRNHEDSENSGLLYYILWTIDLCFISTSLGIMDLKYIVVVKDFKLLREAEGWP